MHQIATGCNTLNPAPENPNVLPAASAISTTTNPSPTNLSPTNAPHPVHPPAPTEKPKIQLPPSAITLNRGEQFEALRAGAREAYRARQQLYEAEVRNIERVLNDKFYQSRCRERKAANDLNTLTPTQTRAVHLLVAGESDLSVARTLGVNRSTIYRWRLYHPAFIARLNALRNAAVQSTVDLLRSSLPDAVRRLVRSLTDPDPARSHSAAVQLLRISGTARHASQIGPQSANEVLHERFRKKQLLSSRPSGILFDAGPTTRDLEEICASLLDQIEAEPDEAALPPETPSAETPSAEPTS